MQTLTSFFSSPDTVVACVVVVDIAGAGEVVPENT